MFVFFVMITMVNRFIKVVGATGIGLALCLTLKSENQGIAGLAVALSRFKRFMRSSVS